jgi:hypothetical protein
VKRANGRKDVKGGALALALLALTAGACATAQPGLGRSAAIPDASEVPSEPGSESWDDAGAQDGESSADDGSATEDGLRQLLGEAEAVLSGGGAGNAALRDALARAMADLQAALERKAAQLEGGDPAAGAAADADVTRGADAVRSALTAIQEGSAIAGGAEGEGTYDEGAYEAGASFEDAPAPGFLQKVTSVLDASLQIIERIQSLRAAVRGFREDAGTLDLGARPDWGGSELEEIAGVVSEGGQPVAGASVTMPGLGHAATTGADGSYTLTGVPARPASLQVVRGGRTVAEGRVAVQPGRPAVADFDLARSGSRLRRGASVLPSQMTVRGGSGPRGTVRGSVEDAKGRPVPLASVRMPGLAVARTDSAGRFVFRGVPAGAQTIVVSRPGASDATERVQVRDRQVSEPRIRMALATSRGGRKEATRKEAKRKETRQQTTPSDRAPRSHDAGGGPATAKVRVCASDAKTGRPLPGAAITLEGGRGSRERGDHGGCASLSAAPGSYRVRAEVSGFATAQQSIRLAAGDSQRVTLRLHPRVAPGERRDPGRESARGHKQASQPPKPKPAPKVTPKPGQKPAPKPKPPRSRTRTNEPPRPPASGFRPSH